jgi:hypothetical protein
VSLISDNLREKKRNMKTIWKIGAIVIFYAMSPDISFTQVSINSDSSLPDSSAMLDVKSTQKGFLLPRMTINQRDGIVNPANGLIVFCTDDNHYYFNRGSPSSPVWVLADSQWSNSGSDIYYASGNVGVGTANPTGAFDVFVKDNSSFRILTSGSYFDTGQSVFQMDHLGRIRMGDNNSGPLTSPGTTCRVELQTSDGHASDLGLKVSYPNDDYAPFYWLLKSKGTLNNPLDVSNGSRIGGIVCAPFINLSYKTAAKIAFYVNGNAVGDTVPVDMIYYNHGADVNSDGGIERWRVKDNGNFGIATPYPSEKLEVNGNIVCDSTFKINQVLHLAPISQPSSGVEGDIYYDVASHKIGVYTNTGWKFLKFE